jgi:PAS domain S-box-containing protein
MINGYDVFYISATTQLLLTVCLATLLWGLYTRLQRFAFFHWWAWAWTAFAAFLLTATISLRLGPGWTLKKAGVVLLLLILGFLQPVLLILGGVSWRAAKPLSRRLFWGGMALVLAAALVCFAGAIALRQSPLQSFAVRNAPRTLALACGLLFCFLVFWQEFRRSRSYAAAIAAIFCLSYAVDQMLYCLSFTEMLLAHWNLQYPAVLHTLANLQDFKNSRLLLVDLVETCGICLGMILLLVERYQHTVSALELSELQRLGLSVDNASLQEEIQNRLKVESELRRSEEFSRQIVQNCPVAMLVSQWPLQSVASVNEKFTSLFGYTQEEMRSVGDWWPLAYPDPKYRAGVRAQWQQLIDKANQGGPGKLAMEARVRCKDGSFRDIEFHLSLVNDLYVVSFVDLTERKQAMEALQLSEDKFATAFLASPHAMIIVSLRDGRFIDVNASFERQSGYSRDEIVGKTVVSLGMWTNSEDFATIMADSLKRKKIVGREAQLRSKSGRIVNVLYSVEIIDIHGELCAIVAGEDITERLQMESALRESEAKFRLVADTVTSAIWMIQNNRFIYFNQEFERTTGYSREEILAMDPWDMVAPEFRAEDFARAQARLAGEPVPSRCQMTIITKTGETRWLDFAGALAEFNGKPALLASALDITAKKRAEQELKEHLMYMDALVSNLPLGIAIKDENQRVRFCNQAFERMFLYTQAELQGKNLDDVIAAHDKEEAAQLSQAVRSGGVVHTTVRRQRKDGTFIDAELYGVKVFSENSFVGAFAIYQDITERRKSEEKLITLRNRLVRAQEEERARIARDLHDDAGQRLALLSIDLEQLKQAATKLRSSLTQQLETLVKAASEITSDVHNVSRRLHPSQVELLGLAAALSNFCRDFAARNAMDILFVDAGLSQKPAQGAALCLFRVAQEAIRNVQKHSGTQKALVELDEVAGSMRLRISDQGAGFDPDSRDFTQGLGLLSMQERLHSLGGELFIHSRLGGGTCIEACIPLTVTVNSES